MAYTLGTGLKVYLMNPFTTDDLNCPVFTYTAVLVTGVTQPGCSSPDASEQCRSLTLDTVALGQYEVTIIARVEGGKFVTSSVISLVVCTVT